MSPKASNVELNRWLEGSRARLAACADQPGYEEATRAALVAVL